jgi:hypothetical protein
MLFDVFFCHVPYWVRELDRGSKQDNFAGPIPVAFP